MTTTPSRPTATDTDRTGATAADPAAPPRTSGSAGRAPAGPRASLLETAQVVADVLLPTAAQGAIARRPAAIGLAARLGLDRRAVRRLQRVRDRHAGGPVVLNLLGRRLVLALAPADVHRVLENSPEPFRTDNAEKRWALARFQPHGVLISHGEERVRRREYNETVLDWPAEVHRLAGSFGSIARDEAALLADQARDAGRLDWDAFAVAWWRVVRRVVLGVGARDDHAMTDALTRLRREANWSFLFPARRRRTWATYRERLDTHLARAEEGSLAGLMGSLDPDDDIHPADQVGQWLFAFDPAGMASIRALALLAAAPEEMARVREEADAAEPGTPATYRRLRSAVLESVRLWPTTPAILRDSTTDTEWTSPGGTTTVPAGSAFLVYTPFLHRDDETVPMADRFDPDVWSSEEAGRGPGDWPIVPFSEGPGVCPGRNLVLLVASTFLAELVRTLDLSPQRPVLDPSALPGTVSPYDVVLGAGAR